MSSYIYNTSGGSAAGPGRDFFRRSAGLPPDAPAGAPGGPGGPGGPIDLNAEREKILSLFQNDQQFYNQGPANDLRNMIMGRAGGSDMPYSQAVTGQMFNDNAAAGAGQFSSERDMLRRSLGNAGLGGSGIETRALIQAKTRAQHQMAQGRREINSRAALENFGARERAQQQAQAFLGQQASHQQSGAFAEAGFRGQATQSQERPAPASGQSGPQFTGSGTVFDQRAWDKTVQELMRRLETQQQQGISGPTGGVNAAPSPAPWDPSFGGSAPVGTPYAGQRAGTYMGGTRPGAYLPKPSGSEQYQDMTNSLSNLPGGSGGLY